MEAVMEFDWKGILKKVAPALGSAVGGPYGGMATKFLAEKFLGDENATEEQIAEAVVFASPEKLFEIKKLDNDFKLRLRELGIKEYELELQDTASARNMQIATNSWVVPVLAIFTVGGFFAVVGLILTGKVPLDSTLTGFVLGAVSSKAEQIYNFFFGSSKGSKDKTMQLANKK